MKCANCGTENEELETVCVYCGEPLDAQEESPKKGKKVKHSQKKSSHFSGKKLVKPLAVVAAVLVVVILAVLVVSSFTSGGKFDMIDRTALPVIFDDETIYFLTDGGKIDSRLDAEGIKEWNASMDGNVAYFTAQEEEDVMVYVLAGENVYPVTENVDQILMAETGSALAYVLEEELYVYTVDKKTTEKVVSDVEKIVTISPDGKTLAYVGLDGFSYVINDGKVVEIGEDVTVISVSDGGKYIYTIEENEEGDTCLVLRNLKGVVGVVAVGVKDTQTATPGAGNNGNTTGDNNGTTDDGNKNEGGDQPSAQTTTTNVTIPLFYTNKDHTQLIFQAQGRSGYKWYAVEKKELEDEKHDLSGADLLRPVMPAQAQSYTRGDLMILGMDSISDMVYSAADAEDESLKLVYINQKWETSTLVSKVTNVQVGEDGENVFYVKNARLFTISAEAGAQSLQVADDVKSFQVTSDGKGVYFVDEDDCLYYSKSSGSAKMVAEGVDALYITQDGYALFTFEDSLYGVKGTGKVETLVEDFTGGQVWIAAECTYYVVDEDDSMTVYAATRGVKFEKLGVLLEEE